MSEETIIQEENTPLPEYPVKTWHLVVAYDGTDYCGWQVQSTLKTVQGEIRKRLRLMLRCPELVVGGSSRTDAGVHALDQQVCFTAPTPPEFTASEFVRKLNRWLPDDIIVSATEREAGFNVRFGNYGKAYTYCLSPGRRTHPLVSRYVWRTPHELDIDTMRQAAAYLQGEHDFASFAANPGRDIGSTVRNLYRLELVEQDGLLYVVAVGESFLYKMVRGLTGYLVHVGQGYAKPEDVLRVMEAKNRSEAADSAPAKGLFLAKVFWQPDEWKTYTPKLPPFFQTI